MNQALRFMSESCRIEACEENRGEGEESVEQFSMKYENVLCMEYIMF